VLAARRLFAAVIRTDAGNECKVHSQAAGRTTRAGVPDRPRIPCLTNCFIAADLAALSVVIGRPSVTLTALKCHRVLRGRAIGEGTASVVIPVLKVHGPTQQSSWGDTCDTGHSQTVDSPPQFAGSDVEDGVCDSVAVRRRLDAHEPKVASPSSGCELSLASKI
jgi:hypothetical protein